MQNYVLLTNSEIDALISEKIHSQPFTVSAVSQSEFSDAIDGKPETEVLRVMDELMESVKFFRPKLYDVTIEKLKNL